jgi:Flp pilus assembly protein TadD
VWQIGVIPLIAMLFAAVALHGEADQNWSSAGRRRFIPRVLFAVLALICLWAIAIPLAMTVEVRSSQAAALNGNFRSALTDAGTAQNLEPAAASPRLQRALLLEQLGDIPGASQAIAQAEKRERTDWRIWLVASRIATESGRPRLALADYRRAKALNPTSPIFAAG